jgi:hypothetical protein
MPPRKRPKKYKLVVADHPKLRRRWRSWLPALRFGLRELLGNREVFWQLQEVAKLNPKILKDGRFFDWMCVNYIRAQTVAIRSFDDHDRKSRSLARMIYEILENKGVINRETFVRMYMRESSEIARGNFDFDTLAGRNRTCLSQVTIRGDLKKIEDACERVRRFVNKRIAHLNKPGDIRRLPTYDEVDSALNVLDEVFCKYDLLLTAQGMTTMHATSQSEWREILWEAWVPKGHIFTTGVK